jgi:hypothetical protein
LSDAFPIQNGLEQGDALSPLLSTLLKTNATRKFQENKVGLKLNGTHQLLVCADDFKFTGQSKAVPLHAMEAHGGRGGMAPTHT